MTEHDCAVPSSYSHVTLHTEAYRYRRSYRAINQEGLYNSIKESYRKQSPLQPGGLLLGDFVQGTEH